MKSSAAVLGEEGSAVNLIVIHFRRTRAEYVSWHAKHALRHRKDGSVLLATEMRLIGGF